MTGRYSSPWNTHVDRKLAGDIKFNRCLFLCLGDTPAVPSSGPVLRVKLLGIKCVCSF